MTAVAEAMEQLPQDIDIVNLSLGGYTDGDCGAAGDRLRAAGDAQAAQRGRRRGRQRRPRRPFWPAAFKQVLAVGAVEEKGGSWSARVLQQLRLVGRRGRARREPRLDVREGQDQGRAGPAVSPTDPTIAFDGWAAWDGTSSLTDHRRGAGAHDVAQRPRRPLPTRRHLLAPRRRRPPDFPLAVLVDELLP